MSENADANVNPNGTPDSNPVVGNRLEAAVKSLRSENRRGLSPYITAGDGGLDRTLALLRALERAGATCCELGVPFSDPIADGPVLQAAADRALAAGTTVQGILAMVAKFRVSGGQLPIALMSYWNPLGHIGWADRCVELAAVGVDALIIPDLPVEEGDEVRSAAQATDLCTIFFASPTSGERRIQQSVEASRGFLYVVGRTGVTGAGTTFDQDAQGFLQSVRAQAGDLPIAVGFGIRTPADVAAATLHADIAIVGTALVQHIHDAALAASENPDQAAVAAAEHYVAELCPKSSSPSNS
jgi:tryptophan synthase alpha chain